MACRQPSAFASTALRVVAEVLESVDQGAGARARLCASVAGLFESPALAHAHLDVPAAGWSVALWRDGSEGPRTVTVSQCEAVAPGTSLSDWWQASPCRELVFEAFALPYLAELPMTCRGDVRSLLVLGRDTPFGNEDTRRISGAHRALAALERVVMRMQPPVIDSATTRAGLTARETEVLLLLSQGLLARSIAGRLQVSERTVHRHLGNVYRKLGAHDRLLAVQRGQSLGLVPEQGGAADVLEPVG